MRTFTTTPVASGCCNVLVYTACTRVATAACRGCYLSMCSTFHLYVRFCLILKLEITLVNPSKMD